MIELQEREEQAAAEEKANAEKSVHDKLMREANLDGVESLIEDMVRHLLWECGRCATTLLMIGAVRREPACCDVARPECWCSQ